MARKKKGPVRGGPSNNEAAYTEHLDALVASGEVLNYFPQPEPIELAHRCTYQPDFMVALASGQTEYVEVKGAKGKRPWFRDDGARVKAKVAARLIARKWTGVALVVVWPRSKKDGGGWCREVVPT